MKLKDLQRVLERGVNSQVFNPEDQLIVLVDGKEYIIVEVEPDIESSDIFLIVKPY